MIHHNTRIRSTLLRTALPVALLAGLSSYAQLAYAAAPAPAKAEQGNTVGEVVVTAQFREQGLQKTPIAITAVNAKMLEQRNQTDIAAVAGQAPNVTLQPSGAAFGSSMVAFIRGVGQTDFNLALEPGVGIYVDDVDFAAVTGSMLDLLDLDRVEVLRGPQGTLAGKNSIGGAIKLYSKKPNGEGGGYVEGTYGSLNRIDARGAADFTVVPDKMFVRASFASKHHDGYVTRVDYACTHPGSNIPTHAVGDGCVLGHDGSQAFDAARIALRWLPTEKIEVNLSADATNDQSSVQANTLLATNPAGLGPLTYIDGLNGAPVTFGPQFIPWGPNSQDTNKATNNPYMSYATFSQNAKSFVFGADPWAGWSVPPINHLKSWGLSSDINWKLTDSITITSITAYRRLSNQFAEQTDASPIGVQLLLQKNTFRQLSQEFRLNGSVGKLIDYTVGGFYMHTNGGLNARVGLPWVGFDFIHGPDSTPSTTKAVFGNAEVHVTDKFNVVGGLRYSDDVKDYAYFRHNADGTLINPAGYNGLVAADNGLTGHYAGTRLDYRIDADYHFTSNVMGYVETSTGYKGGGVDPRPFVPTQAVSFSPETLTAYEVGLKTNLFDHHMRLNMSAFYNNYNNIQLTLNSCPAQSGGNAAIPCALPANIGSAHVKGLEAEAEIHPVAGLEIDGSASYLNFKYTNILNAAASGVTLAMATPYTPKWKWSFGVQYEMSMGNSGSLTPRVDATYQSSIFTGPINDPLYNKINGYTVFNGRLTWRAPEGGWQTSLNVSNLTNKLYYLTLFDGHAGGGYTSGQPAMPREWSVTVKKTF